MTPAPPREKLSTAPVRVADQLPGEWVVVTRDLYADNGDFTLNGLALSPVDGEFALFDHIYPGPHAARL